LIDELRTKVHELRHQVRDARHEADEAWGKVHAEQKENGRLAQTVREMQAERDNMSLGVKKQEAQIRQVQALAFEGIGGDSWAAGDDSTARADLEKLHSRLKNWAKKYAIGEMSEVRGLASDEHASLIQLLAEVVRFRSGAPDANKIEHLQSGPMNRKSPAVCIQGLFSHHVYANIMGQPFFALGDAGKALQHVYRAINQGEKFTGEINPTGSRVLMSLKSTKVNLICGAPGHSGSSLPHQPTCNKGPDDTQATTTTPHPRKQSAATSPASSTTVRPST
jgi:hypothetical protein